MATDRPRIQGYLDPALHESFVRWKQERGIEKDSEALNQLLAEYFGVDSQPPASNPQSSITTEQIEEMIAAQLERKFDDKIPKLVEGVIVAYSCHWMENFNSRFEQLDTRLKAAENMLDVKDGVPTLLQEALETVHMQRYIIEDLLGSESLSKPPSEPSESLNAGRSPESGSGQENIEPSPQAISRRLIEYLGDGKGLEDETLGEPPSELQNEPPSELQNEPPSELQNEPPSELQNELPSELPSDESESLTQTELAKRFGCHKSLISRQKERGDFDEWSRAKDPKAIAWHYDRRKQKFFPVS